MKLKSFSRRLILAAITGVCAGFGAVLFFYALELCTSLLLGLAGGYNAPAPPGEGRIFDFGSDNIISWRIPLVMGIVGLITGIIVYKIAPEAEGHGTDAYISAFHHHQGKIRARAPVIKAIASALIIGSGGSAGREGPIAQIGSGSGSVLATKLGLTDKDRRLMVICGAAGGIGAIFKAPFGGAIFALEVLYMRDVESDALIPAFISSTVAYSIFCSFFGFDPIFGTSGCSFRLETLYLYAFLGLVCAVFAIAFIVFFNFTRTSFKKMKIPNIYKPAIGMGLAGLLALLVPAVLGPGYGWVQLAIFSQLSLFLLIVIIGAKILATSLVIGSGGSGGVFGPSLVIGGAIGACFIQTVIVIFPEMQSEASNFVIVGMAAFVTGVANVLISPIIMVAEMTGTYTLLVPAMIACTFTYIFSLNWTIYESQVLNKAESPVHRNKFVADILEDVDVSELMIKDAITIDPEYPIDKVAGLIISSGITIFPVISENMLIGRVTHKDIIRSDIAEKSLTTVKEIMQDNVVTTTPDEKVSEALDKMNYYELETIPVIESKENNKFLGVLTKIEIIKGHMIAKKADISSKNE